MRSAVFGSLRFALLMISGRLNISSDPPSAISRPSFSTIIRSANWLIISTSWEEMITVIPSLPSSRSVSMMSSAAWGSSPAVGSSRTIISGFIARIPAIAIFFFSPPLRWCGGRSPYPPIPTLSRDPLTRLSTSSSSSPRFTGPNAMSSNTVGENSWSSGFWNTIPTL